MPCVSCASPLVPSFRRSPCTRAAERAAMFVREADEAVCLDADDRRARVGQPVPRPRRRSNGRCAALAADAAWVGWGFVAERPEFAELCERLGIVFVGPRPDVMRKLGDKIAAKLLAEQADVPVAAWSGGPVDDGRGGSRSRRANRLPADGQGRGGRRRPRHPSRRRSGTARRGVRERQVRGRQGVRRPDGLPRARRHRRPPRRGPADRRPLRHGVGARRPRLQHAATQPEGHRGVAVHRPHARSRTPTYVPPPSAWPRSPGTPTPEPSSSSTSRRTNGSPSSRSTPGCRSSIPSPS